MAEIFTHEESNFRTPAKDVDSPLIRLLIDYGERIANLEAKVKKLEEEKDKYFSEKNQTNIQL